MCPLGYLYNREPVLQCLKEQLVDGVPLPALVRHIGAMKDLTTLQLAHGDGDGADVGGVASAGDFRAATHVRVACPLTGAPPRNNGCAAGLCVCSASCCALQCSRTRTTCATQACR